MGVCMDACCGARPSTVPAGLGLTGTPVKLWGFSSHPFVLLHLQYWFPFKKQLRKKKASSLLVNWFQRLLVHNPQERQQTGATHARAHTLHPVLCTMPYESGTNFLPPFRATNQESFVCVAYQSECVVSVLRRVCSTYSVLYERLDAWHSSWPHKNVGDVSETSHRAH